MGSPVARGKATAARRPQRHSRTSRRLLQGVLSVAAFILLAGFLGLGPTTPAQAEDPDSLVSIQITSMTPALPTPTDTITLTGTVTNTSKKPIDKPRVYFWRNQAPITDREGFDAALKSASNDPLGARVTADVQNREHLWSEDDPNLDPGETAAFTVSATPEQLDFPAADGIYLVGVHVLTGTDQPPAIGRARVFAPVVTDLPDQVLPTSSVVILNSRPARLQDQIFADDHLAGELAPNGRLTQLLAAAQQEGMTFAVDPSLIEELKVMRTGYQVRDADGATTAGTGSELAAGWLRSFGTLLGSSPGYQLLYGSPDIAALVRSDRAGLLKRAKTAGAAVPETAGLPLLVWPGDGAADAETIAAAGKLGPAGILLSDATTRSAAPLLHGADGPPIINYLGTASLGGPGPDPSDSPVHQRERTLSDTWLQASTEKPDESLGQVRLITTPDEARTAQQLAAPWLRQIPLADLLEQRPVRLTDEPRYPKAAQAAELDHGDLRRVDDLAEAYETYVDLLVDPAKARPDADAALAKSVSATWRGPDSGWADRLRLQQDQLDQVLTDAVKIGLVSRFTTTGQSDISFPITITNSLLGTTEAGTVNAIRVGVEFTSAQSQRLKVKALDPIVIRANSSKNSSITRNTQVEAQANGPVEVTAQLITASGRRVGKPTQVEVTVTQAGTVGWIIAIAAGIVLIGTTVLRIRQVARERARERDDEDDAETRAPPPAASPTSPRRATVEATALTTPRRERR